MTPSTLKSFTAVLEPLQNGLGWVVARIPFDVAKAWPVRKRLRVRGEIEEFPFRTSLFPFASGGGHFLLVNKKMQAGAKAKVGSKVKIRIEPDLEERAAIVPPELAYGRRGYPPLIPGDASLIFDVEVLGVEMQNPEVEKMLVAAQRDVIQSTLVLASERRKLDFTKQTDMGTPPAAPPAGAAPPPAQ